VKEGRVLVGVGCGDVVVGGLSSLRFFGLVSVGEGEAGVVGDMSPASDRMEESWYGVEVMGDGELFQAVWGMGVVLGGVLGGCPCLFLLLEGCGSLTSMASMLGSISVMVVCVGGRVARFGFFSFGVFSSNSLFRVGVASYRWGLSGWGISGVYGMVSM
jgi:hypothetical protein